MLMSLNYPFLIAFVTLNVDVVSFKLGPKRIYNRFPMDFMRASMEKDRESYSLLSRINSPTDLKLLNLDELPLLCQELRQYMKDILFPIGGHYSSSLGVVELTVMLHRIFDSPNDRIVWDIGHQAYVHKILTGRRDRLHSIRQKDGISGYCRRYESAHDQFGAGHSSTSIGALQGLYEADLLQGKHKDKNYICIIGDGGMTAGLAFESLNYSTCINSPLIIIYNDNEQSSLPTGLPAANGTTPILPFFMEKWKNVKGDQTSSHHVESFSSSPTTTRDCLGPDSRYTQRFDKSGITSLVEGTKGNLSAGEDLISTRDNTSSYSSTHLSSSFSDFSSNFDNPMIVGPVDGHDLTALDAILNEVKARQSESINYSTSCNRMEAGKPIILHVKTVKGQGCELALKSLDRLHSINVGCSKRTYTDVFSDTLIELGRKDEKIVAITAAMPGGTGVGKFGKVFPSRTFDVGIAEQHAVTFSAGLALGGMKPYCCIYSTFLQRSFDQIIHDVALQNAPVKFIIDRAGYVGRDGSSHHGLYDLSYLRPIPNFIIMAPSNELELELMLKFSAEIDKFPCAIRFPKQNTIEQLNIIYPEANISYGVTQRNASQISVRDGTELTADPAQGSGTIKDDTHLREMLYKEISGFKSRLVRRGNGELAIFALGTILLDVIKAADLLELDCSVIDVRFLKPLDAETINEIARDHDTFITVEDGLTGGLGSAVLEYLSDHNLQKKVRTLRYPSEHIHHASQLEQRASVGMDAIGISNQIQKILNEI